MGNNKAEWPPEWRFWIFGGIGKDFEIYWQARDEKYPNEAKEAEAKTNAKADVLEWCDKYLALYRLIIPETQVACRIETKQDYEDFSKVDIVHVIELLGKLCQFMYNPHSIMREQILSHYYYLGLEQIAWIVTSFVNMEHEYCNFTSLHDKWSMMLGESEGEDETG